MLRGFMYLVGVTDWHSRYVLARQLSNTLDGNFCLDALPTAYIQVSMNGLSCALDNFC